MREAGYRETRIFTPDAKTNGADSTKGSIRGAVVDFLSHLVPSAAASRSSSQAAPHNPSTSPLANNSRTSLPSHSRSNSLLSLMSTSSGSSDSTPQPTPSKKRATPMIKSYSTPQSASLRAPDDFPSRLHFDHGPRRPLERSITNADRVDSAPSRLRHGEPDVLPRREPPSHATAYLRHIASVPSMQRPASPLARPRALPMYVSTIDTSLDGIEGRGNGEGEEEAPPPLPKTWLESVARAVLYGGGSAHTGMPSSQRPRDSSPFSSHSMHPTPPHPFLPDASDSHTGYFDQSLPPAHDARPNLLTRVVSTKSRRSESVVSRTRVVCRSAPVSRNGSRVRSGDDRRIDRRSKRSKHVHERARGRKAKNDETCMPSLSRTKVEGDDWIKQRHADSSRPWAEHDQGFEETVLSDSPSSATSEDEAEPSLARILVGPKRHNSIRSLRRHLGTPRSASSIHATTPLLSRARSGRRLRSDFVEGSLSHDNSVWPSSVPNDEPQRKRRSQLSNPGDEADYHTFLSGRGSTHQQAKRKSIPPSWSGRVSPSS